MERRKQITNLISDFLSKYSTWSSILIFFGLILLFSFLIFPLFHATDQKTIILDAQFSYSTEKAYEILAKFSDKELNKYMIGALTADFIYPIVYTLFFSLFIFKFSKKHRLSLFPLLILFSDYLENVGIVTIIHYLPQKLPNIVIITSLFTSIKWILVSICILIIVVLLLKKLYRQNQKR